VSLGHAFDRLLILHLFYSGNTRAKCRVREIKGLDLANFTTV